MEKIIFIYKSKIVTTEFSAFQSSQTIKAHVYRTHIQQRSQNKTLFYHYYFIFVFLLFVECIYWYKILFLLFVLNCSVYIHAQWNKLSCNNHVMQNFPRDSSWNQGSFIFYEYYYSAMVLYYTYINTSTYIKWLYTKCLWMLILKASIDVKYIESYYSYAFPFRQSCLKHEKLK